MRLSDFRHKRQQHEDDCLVACCKMVLGYLGIEKSESWLWQRLRTGTVTPFPNIEKLAPELGLSIEVGEWLDLAALEPHIDSGLPVLVAVHADNRRHWPYVDNHAVVVIGFNEQSVFIHDPAQVEAPLEIDMDTFLLAWANRDYEYGVIRLAEDL